MPRDMRQTVFKPFFPYDNTYSLNNVNKRHVGSDVNYNSKAHDSQLKGS